MSILLSNFSLIKLIDFVFHSKAHVVITRPCFNNVIYQSMKNKYQKLIEYLQTCYIGSTVEWEGKKATVKLSYRVNNQGDVCSKCLFRHLRGEEDACPIFKACCRPFRPDKQSVMFLDLERNREIVDREIERSRKKRAKLKEGKK